MVGKSGVKKIQPYFLGYSGPEIPEQKFAFQNIWFLINK